MAQECKQPYTFVPVVTNNTQVHDVTFHDGKGSDEKLTGVIECTLVVKTPMIVGHYQYTAEYLRSRKSGAIRRVNIRYGHNNSKEAKIIENPSEHIILPEDWEGSGYPQRNNDHNSYYIVHKKKSILEPLFLNGNHDSPVLIAGTSLKGMVRHAIGAITNSPMERVNEKQFSYRPGLVYSTQRNAGHYKLYRAEALSDLQEPENIELTEVLRVVLKNQRYRGEQESINLDEDLVTRYKLTTHTYEDKKRPKERTGERRNDNDFFSIKTGDVLFVEYDQSRKKIVSFGNHEQYRWIYADTTTQVQIGATGKHKLRPQTSIDGREKVTTAGGQLTGARLLFGYAEAEDDSGEAESTISSGGTYSRLAGRISINTAVEVCDPTDTLKMRFIVQKGNHNIPLKILSTPKASAVECYIDQSTPPRSGVFNTYGDFPGFVSSGKPLSGRKFYWRWCPDPDDYMLTPDGSNNGYVNSIALAGRQSTIARYISNAGRKFKFSVRFKDMSGAELGALLSALSPHLHREPNSEYWQQIGHGRPLGLGSVKINPDQIKFWDGVEWYQSLSKQTDYEEYIDCFKNSELCNNDNLDAWLNICSCGDRREYMTTKDHGDNRLAHIRKVRNCNIPTTTKKCFGR